MPLYNQQAVNPRALSANQCLIFVGGQVIAFAQTITHTFDLGTQQLYGIGSAMIQEIQQLRINPSITLDSFELSAAGQERIEGNPFGVSLASFIVNNQFTISIQEANNTVDGSGTTVFFYVGCQANNFSESIPTNQIVTKTISFSALDVRDVTGTSILNRANFADLSHQFNSLGIGELAG